MIPSTAVFGGCTYSWTARESQNDEQHEDIGLTVFDCRMNLKGVVANLGA